MNNYEIVVYFSQKHLTITTIKAKSFEEAIEKAYKKFSYRNIIKIEPIFQREFIPIEGA